MRYEVRKIVEDAREASQCSLVEQFYQVDTIPRLQNVMAALRQEMGSCCDSVVLRNVLMEYADVKYVLRKYKRLAGMGE